MRTFDVQAIEIKAPVNDVFDYIAAPKHLPDWTHAFKWVSDGRARMETANGSVEIKLKVRASKALGTIDWVMAFPDGSIGVAYSRVVDSGRGSSIYSFVLLAPPLPLEQIEGALQHQIAILREELSKLAEMWEQPESTPARMARARETN